MPAVLPVAATAAQNAIFYRTWAEAEAAGFRACRKCRPRQEAIEPRAQLVAQACRRIAAVDPVPSLADLAAEAGLSPSHFQRLFKRLTGVTPKAYALEQRGERIRRQLGRRAGTTRAIFAAGFGSTSRFYEKSARLLGMSPKAFRQGGAGTEIRFAVGRCWLGSILVAATERGVCAIQLGDDPAELVRALKQRFPAPSCTRQTPPSGKPWPGSLLLSTIRGKASICRWICGVRHFNSGCGRRWPRFRWAKR